MDIKELRQKLKMTQKEFGEYLNIPQRTIQSWELGDRTPPEYVLELIKFKIKKERLIMKKFELFKNTVEINWREKDRIKEGCTIDHQRDCDPVLIKSFDNGEKALEELSNYQSNIRELKGNLGIYYEVTEYYIQETIYNEDGDFIEGGDIWEFSKMPEL